MNIRTDTWSMTIGDVSIQWNDDISIDELEDIEIWMDICKRKILRAIRRQYQEGGRYFVGPLKPTRH